MGVWQSGRLRLAVNQVLNGTVVRIHPHPPSLRAPSVSWEARLQVGSIDRKEQALVQFQWSPPRFGLIVYRLVHWPVTPEGGVRFPLGPPNNLDRVCS